MLLRRTKRSLDWSNPVLCSIAIKPLAPEPGGPHPKSNVTMKGGVERGFPPANRGMADIDDMATALTLSAVCFWNPRFAHDSNICRKDVTDRPGRLRYTCADIHIARCRDDAEHKRSTGEAIAGRSTWLRVGAHLVVLSKEGSLAIAASQPVAYKWCSSRVFEKKHYMECTTKTVAYGP